MSTSESGLPKRPDSREPASGKGRFDGEAARQILQRAVAEQQRLNNKLADSWSFEELEEMAAEAGISSEALRAAVEAHGSKSGASAARTPFPDERPRRRLPALRSLMPGSWSTAVRGVVLTTAGGIAVVAGLMLAFPAVAEAVFWALLLFLVLLAVLVVLGAAPF